MRESGSGEIQVDDRVEPVAGGDCVTVMPGEVHEVRNTGSEDLAVLVFGVEMQPG